MITKKAIENMLSNANLACGEQISFYNSKRKCYLIEIGWDGAMAIYEIKRIYRKPGKFEIT